MVSSHRTRLRRRLRVQVEGWLFVGPAILFLLVFTVYPLVRAVIMSLSQVSSKGEIGAWIGFVNWPLLLKDERFLSAVGRSLWFAALGTAGGLVLGLVQAQLLNTRWIPPRLTNFLRGLCVLPWIFSMAVAALMWGLLLHRDGLFNAVLQALGVTKTAIMFVGNPNFALSSLSAIFIWRVTPFVMVMVLAALKAIPIELNEAAIVDGANKWQVYRSITLPLIMPLLLTLGILCFVWGIGQFDLMRIITGGGPMSSTETVSYYIYRVGFLTVNWSYGAAISVAIFLVNVLFAIAYLILSARAKPWG